MKKLTVNSVVHDTIFRAKHKSVGTFAGVIFIVTQRSTDGVTTRTTPAN